jgi:osmotically-inducible protein OsmY
MGWLKRVFGTDKPKDASTKVTAGRRPQVAAKPAAAAPAATAEEELPVYRIGLTGEYDESGLAKRVTLAFDEDPDLDDVETRWVAQLSGTVVLKGTVPSQAILSKMVAVAKTVDGTEAVETSQVTIA